MNFQERLALDASGVEDLLKEEVAGMRERDPSRLVDAMEYSLLAGGKRLRSVLCLWVARAFTGDENAATIASAKALEMLHCYSLIHDDLPAMDDDDLRRGKASCHRKFDEATAILAGDALQTEAFRVLSEVKDPELAIKLIVILAKASGTGGMATGQMLDLLAEQAQPVEALLLEIHSAKTGALLGAALAMGACSAGASQRDVFLLRQAGIDLGIAFQIADDILDVEAEAAVLGKTSGKDESQKKLSSVRCWGIERSRDMAREHHAKALKALEQCAFECDDLKDLFLYLIERKY